MVRERQLTGDGPEPRDLPIGAVDEPYPPVYLSDPWTGLDATLEVPEHLVDRPAAEEAPRFPASEVTGSEHFIQLYETDTFLVSCLTGYVGAGLTGGDACIVVATPEHRRALEERLKANGLDLATFSASGQYVPVDAAELLSRFMLHGAPDPIRFVEAVGDMIERASAGRRAVRIFGEMVAILWARGNRTAAIQLEGLWNDLHRTYPFSLVCAYPVADMEGEDLSGPLAEVCSEHTHVIPAESATWLTGPADRLRAIALLQHRAHSLEAEVEDRRQSEETLRESEERFRAAFAHAATGMALTDLTGRFLQVNDAYCTITGYSAEELAELDFNAISHPDDRERKQQLIQKMLAGEIPSFVIEKRYVRKDGMQVWVQNSISLLRDGRGKPANIIAITEDISERKRVEEELARSARLAALGAEIGTALTQPVTLQQMLQACAEAIVRHLDAAFVRIWMLEQERQTLELQASAGMYTHLDGFHGSVPVGELKIGRIAETRQPHVTNQVATDPEIGDHAWAEREGILSFAGYPLQIGDRIVGVMAMFSRHPLATDAVQALESVAHSIALGIERQLAEAALTRSLQLRNEFLATVSHDLKTPLTVLKGQAQLLQRRAVRGTLGTEPMLEGLGQIESKSRMMTALIDELLDVTRLRAGEELQLDRREVDLVALVQETVAGQEESVTQRRLVVRSTEEELLGRWDPLRLGRVLENLIGNAVKYSPDGSEITISLTRERGAGRDEAVLAVQDRGIGISEHDLPHIFDRFYRGENAQGGISGSGLGLAGTRQIVEQHGGTIEVDSREGAGSTFTVRLPLSPASG